MRESQATSPVAGGGGGPVTQTKPPSDSPSSSDMDTTRLTSGRAPCGPGVRGEARNATAVLPLPRPLLGRPHPWLHPSLVLWVPVGPAVLICCCLSITPSHLEATGLDEPHSMSPVTEEQHRRQEPYLRKVEAIRSTTAHGSCLGLPS